MQPRGTDAWPMPRPVLVQDEVLVTEEEGVVAFSRQQILDAFGVTEKELAELEAKTGWNAAHEAAERDREEFIGEMHVRAALISEELGEKFSHARFDLAPIWPMPTPASAHDVLVTPEEAQVFRQAREALWRIQNRARTLGDSRTAYSSERPNALACGMVAESASMTSDVLFSFLATTLHVGQEKNVDLGIDREGA